tara:strand:+ start:1832 stop:2458 length:627 start_codon:yes stop_codon:yes gene_type:complete
MSSSINLISIGNKEFNLSLIEIKQFLKFHLFVEDDFKDTINFEKYDVIMIYEKNLNQKKINFLNKLDKIVVLVSEQDSKFFSNRFSVIKLPTKIDDINSIILNLDIKRKFSLNSSIKIKDFILNINDRKILRNNEFIEITEKEIELIKTLLNSKIPVKKDKILNSVWKYSKDADTHTVETHIYRLRKKMKDKFNEQNFIINKKDGYII